MNINAISLACVNAHFPRNSYNAVYRTSYKDGSYRLKVFGVRERALPCRGPEVGQSEH